MKSLDLRNIAEAGGNIIISASEFTKLDLSNIASSGAHKKSKLTIKNAEKLSVLDCRNIASANPGNVTFDFSD
jgi:hypothetical protein